MARPETAMVAPAMTLTHLSSGLVLIRLRPSLNASTTVIIVAIVAAEKSSDTRITPWILFSAAGYISIGISGSHGPRTNIRKRIHGVRFFLSERWICEW